MKKKYRLMLVAGIILPCITLYLLPISVVFMYFVLKNKNRRWYMIRHIFIIFTRFLRWVGDIKAVLIPNSKKRKTFILYDSAEKTLQLMDSLSIFERMLERKMDAYYLCSKKHPQYASLKLAYKKHIIGFNSIQNILLRPFLLAKTKAILEAYGSIATKKNNLNKFLRRSSIKLIFLQHGITFFKDTYVTKKTYHRKNYDKIVVSNELEKKIYEERGGFSDCEPSDFIKAGLPRWDYLEPLKPKQKSILIYFTHRKTFTKNKNYEDSLYYKNLVKLLKNKELNESLKKNNVTLNVAVHHTLRHKNPTFQLDENITFVDEFQIDRLKCECDMLVTDYSSMCFEFFRQNKPVIFYRLDRGDKFLMSFDKKMEKNAEKKNKHIFNICRREKEVLNLIQKYVENGFKLERKKRRKSEKFFYDIPAWRVRDTIIDKLLDM